MKVMVSVAFRRVPTYLAQPLPVETTPTTVSRSWEWNWIIPMQT